MRLRSAKHIRSLVAALAVVALSATTPAEAGTAGAQMGVSAKIPNSCNASNGTALSFGVLPASLTIASPAPTGTGTITVTCINGGLYTVIANTGANDDGSGQRRMRKGSTTAYLTYNIYTDSTRSTLFPTSVASASNLTAGTGAQTISVYGSIPVGATTTEAGDFTDTVNFTVTF